MYFFGFLQTGTRVRKSSLATPKSGPRKKSIVSFDESTTTTIEYAETSESEKKENDEESETSKMLVVLVIIVKIVLFRWRLRGITCTKVQQIQ